MLIASCIIRFDQNTMDKYLDYASFQIAMKTSNISANIPTSLNIGETLNTIFIVFVTIGISFLLLGVLGTIGAVRKVKALLVTYAVLLLVFLVLELICVVLLTTIGNKIEGWIKDSLRDSIRDHYVGINGNDTSTLRWNFIMHSFKCCGVENYTDFRPAKKWGPNIPNGGIVSRRQLLPFACCKVKNDQNCVYYPSSENAYIDTGCYHALRNWFVDMTDIFVGIGASVFVIELMLVVFVFIICCTLGKQSDYDDNEENDAMQPYRVPHEHFRSPKPNLFYPRNPVYNYYDSSVEIYPSRSFKEHTYHNYEHIDAYGERHHDRHIGSLRPNQIYGETYQRTPSRTSIESLYSSEVQWPKAEKEKQKRPAAFGVLCYCGGPPPE
ncbi:hypothetical protein CHS0354_015342 [Potamilus streckersoni]|uniref:Tetraspanin n=1 Tax=Potamilus streckersoni TaxID=2493646 RepID=A0AAE0SUK5_9BIVA|nr:hypothetical protein CHS0354_015342 [Potamilus streckersoni]